MKIFGHSIFKLISSYVCHEVSGSHPAPPPTVLDIDDLLRSLVLRFHFLSFRNWNMSYSHQKGTFRGPRKVLRPTWTPILPKKMIPPTLGKTLAPWASSQACVRAGVTESGEALEGGMRWGTELDLKESKECLVVRLFLSFKTWFHCRGRKQFGLKESVFVAIFYS